VKRPHHFRDDAGAELAGVERCQVLQKGVPRRGVGRGDDAIARLPTRIRREHCSRSAAPRGAKLGVVGRKGLLGHPAITQMRGGLDATTLATLRRESGDEA
jgi:hypothetical protein